jgi:nicotinamide-nucleotide amidase
MPMRIEIVHIGDELVEGDHDPLPIPLLRFVHIRMRRVARMTLVGDVEEDIISSMTQAQRDGADLLVVTGGLGPTLDDITREALARYLGTELEMDEEAVGWMVDNAKMRGKDLKVDDVCAKMARVPSGAEALRNPIGLACGIRAFKDGMEIVCLPGMPREMVAMYREHVFWKVPMGEMFEREVHTYHSECLIEPLLEDVKYRFGVEVASLPSESSISPNRILLKGLKERVEKAERYLNAKLEAF